MTTSLTIRSVLDRRRPEGHQLLDAQAWLASLSEAGYTDLRRATTEGTLIVCAECGWPVYAPDTPSRRPFFQHHKGYPRTCCYSGEGADPRQIDAERFAGVQEGPRHRALKGWLCEILGWDKDVQELAQERHTRLGDGRFARPDVYAAPWQGGPIAFDIQLATTQMPVVVRRERFYEDAGIRYVWITDRDPHQLMRRAFRDIYMRNDGQIFGVDEEVRATARRRQVPLFRVHRLTPGPAAIGFAPVLREGIYGVEEIDWGTPGGRPRRKALSYDALMAWMCERDETIRTCRQAFYQALAGAEAAQAGFHWNAMQAYAGGMVWQDLPCDPAHAVRALGVIASVHTGRLCVPASTRSGVELVNAMLLEPRSRWVFAELFEQVAHAAGRQSLLERPSVRDKLARAKTRTLSLRLARRVGPVFDAFFPLGAFQRLDLDALLGP